MKFMIFAHMRSGSTTLMDCLNQHPQLSCLSEPFNPGNPASYFTQVASRHSLQLVLDRIERTHNGIKHLWEIFPEDWNQYLIQKYRTVFLYRKNILRTVISETIAQQSDYWGTDRKKANEFSQFYPPDLDYIKRRIQFFYETRQVYEKYIASEKPDTLQVSYEELYQPKLEGRLSAFNTISSYLGVNDWKQETLEWIGGRLSPDAKINDSQSYAKLPGIEQIRAMGNDDIGYL